MTFIGICLIVVGICMIGFASALFAYSRNPHNAGVESRFDKVSGVFLFGIFLALAAVIIKLVFPAMEKVLNMLNLL